MGLTAQQSQQLYGTPAYTGWGETEAMYDARSKGLTGGPSTTSASNNTVDGILNNAISSITSQVKPITPYEQVNPFSFDEQLATQAATAEYTPYYQQLLSDYTQNVETTKSRSQQDLKSTLSQLAAGKEYYQGTQRRLLDNAIDQTNRGYAGNGLFFSGARQRDINQIQTQYNADTGNYNQQYNYNTSQANLGNTRTQEDQNTALAQYTRNNAQALKTGIAQGVLQRQNEAVQQYQIGRQQYYTNQGLTGLG